MNAIKFTTTELNKFEQWAIEQVNKNQGAIRDMMAIKAPGYVIQNLRDENWALGLLVAKLTREWSEARPAPQVTTEKIEPGAGPLVTRLEAGVIVSDKPLEAGATTEQIAQEGSLRVRDLENEYTFDAKRVVSFEYNNYEGHQAWRNAAPITIWWGSTEWHKEEQWFLKAFDIDKKAVRDFAILDIMSGYSPYPIFREGATYLG